MQETAPQAFRLQHGGDMLHIPHSTIPLAERRALTLHMAEDYSGLKRSSLYELLARGELESLKIGGRRLILRASLDALLSGRSLSK
jgi:excisionase family DNA binding protein